MPLRDHFRPPLFDRRPWGGLHGAWPTKIVELLNQRLPERYLAEPQVQLGSSIEVDIGTFDDEEDCGTTAPGAGDRDGGVATAIWAPPEPTLAISTGPPDEDEYEVRVYDTFRTRRLVASVEIVSPRNKDRPESRRAFLTKCSALIRKFVSVTVVDLVTTRSWDFHAELMDDLGQAVPPILADLPGLSAVSYRWMKPAGGWSLEAWAHTLVLGEPLPTLPLWLASNLAVPLELEGSYEETCRVLRIA